MAQTASEPATGKFNQANAKDTKIAEAWGVKASMGVRKEQEEAHRARER